MREKTKDNCWEEMLQMWQLHIYKGEKAMVNLRRQRGCRDIKIGLNPSDSYYDSQSAAPPSAFIHGTSMR